MFIILFAIALVSSVNGQTATYNCTAGAIDLVFVMDQSGSILQSDYRSALDALTRLTDSLTIGQAVDQSRVGFVLFDSYGSVAFQLGQYNTNADVANAIRNLGFSGGGTNIADGMHVATNEVFFGRYRAAPRVMVVVTDGQDTSNVYAENLSAQQANITIYVLGVGADVNNTELVQAAGDPSRVYNIDSYASVGQVMDQICYEIESSVAPPPVVHGPRECPCTISNLWLDIVMVLDSSNGVNKEDFNALRALLISFVMQTRISQELGQYTRIAFVNAAKTVIRVSNLTSYGSNVEVQQSIASAINFVGESDFNVGAGLVEAQKILDEAGNRGNARNLVVVFSSRNIECTASIPNKILRADEDPCRIAAHMVEDPKTDLMTVALKFHEDAEFPSLTFGTPCFNATNDNNLLDNLVKFACKSNCFCQHEYVQFDTGDQCHLYGECLYPKGIATPYLSAQIGCQLDQTYLADVENADKHEFLRALAIKDGLVPFWIGLRKEYSQYMWDSGTALAQGDYTNWASGQPNEAVGTCVSVKQTTGFNMQWFTEQCSWSTPSYYYFCQKNTCDTDNYCAVA